MMEMDIAFISRAFLAATPLWKAAEKDKDEKCDSTTSFQTCIVSF